MAAVRRRRPRGCRAARWPRCMILQLASTDRAARSNSALTKSACTPVCSRSRTRAPISMASATTAAGSSPASAHSRAKRTAHFVGDDEAVDAQAVAHDADAGVGERGGGFHGEEVARYSRVLTETPAKMSRMDDLAPAVEQAGGVRAGRARGQARPAGGGAAPRRRARPAPLGLRRPRHRRVRRGRGGRAARCSSRRARTARGRRRRRRRAWLLTAAAVGALVEAAGSIAVTAGEHGAPCPLESPATSPPTPSWRRWPRRARPGHRPPPRARRRAARARPGGRRPARAHRRDPPARRAARVAALGGRPADEGSMTEHEDAVLAQLEAEGAAARPWRARTTTPIRPAGWPSASSSACTAWGSGVAITPTLRTCRAASPATTAGWPTASARRCWRWAPGREAERRPAPRLPQPRRKAAIHALMERGEVPGDLRCPGRRLGPMDLATRAHGPDAAEGRLRAIERLARRSLGPGAP